MWHKIAKGHPAFHSRSIYILKSGIRHIVHLCNEYYKKLPEEAESYMRSEELYAYIQSKTQTSMSLNVFPLKTRRDAECTL